MRFWNRDKSLWTSADEDKWLGWLDIADRQLEQKNLFFEDLANLALSGGYRDAVVVGMGGSSLCPEVLSITFGPQPGFPALHVLDSTDPAEVLAVETLANPKKTLYIVSSKFGSRFIAVTGPGSKMEQVAKADGFVLICYGVPCIGGRYSALSDFGMVPGAVAGAVIGINPFDQPDVEASKIATANSPTSTRRPATFPRNPPSSKLAE
jgi:glucose-6-phosphate isomerase